MKKETEDKGYAQLKQDLKTGQLRTVYVFHGEETYLREYYLDQLRKKLIPAGFEEFNYHKLEGKALSVQALSDIVEALPMMCEKTLVTVTDFDIFKLNEEQRGQLIALLSDFPDYCCLVVVYDIIEYKPDKKMKKLYAALNGAAQIVEFKTQGQSDLINWVTRRFKALGKDIDRQSAEHLIFTCGSLMTGLIPEIEKIAAYTRGTKVSVEDINAVADPVIDAMIYDITNEISRRNYDAAADTLGKLLKMQEEPIVILALIGKELRKLYTARIALDGGKDRYWLMDIWNMRSDYPAKLLLGSAKHFSKEWCRNGIEMCKALDVQMKSQTGFDSEGELKLLLMRLAQEVQA
ncbi:MAG: DNA polymerase III subunit delta [Clostridiales bacterium]|nr:DNA polymerase III subunit delta [bacterium 210917-SL.2.15]MCI5843793.1 DNA polymerase III subunit delta [Clostridiales bacterium]MDY4035904.1 DNA polymerase III subunit delta [Candidatus Pseudoscilispira sp.]